MLQPARKLWNVYASLQAGLASAERVFSITDVQSNIVDTSNPVEIYNFKDQIKFENVSFQ